MLRNEYIEREQQTLCDLCVCVRACKRISRSKKRKKKLKILRDETKTRTVEIKWAELAYLCHKMIQCYITRECE